MAVKNLFIPFDSFSVQVCATEIGVLSDLAMQYLTGLGERVHPHTGKLYKDMYFLPYPFQSSFTAHCIDYCSSQKDVEKYYTQWGKEHATTMTEETVLPIRYDKNHTWAAFYASRLAKILDNGITAEEFERCGDMAVLVDSDRTNYAYVDADHDDVEHPSIMVLKASERSSYVRQISDEMMQTEGVVFQSPMAKDPTHEGTTGKVMVGGPYVKYGPHVRRWLMRVSDELIEHFSSLTGYQFESNEIIMADFGDYDECPNRKKCPHADSCSLSECIGFTDPDWTPDERRYAQAHPFERGVAHGEKLHRGTTSYVSPWYEY